MREVVIHPKKNPMKLFAVCPLCGLPTMNGAGRVKMVFSEFGHGPVCRDCYLKEILEAKGMEQSYQPEGRAR